VPRRIRAATVSLGLRSVVVLLRLFWPVGVKLILMVIPRVQSGYNPAFVIKILELHWRL